ncbi:choice-of-anchor D domain-containing protein [candidate division KSB1 bacterium]|nr:choice-of-anchor D domain-containing protein [candidate division KSB1 bacterium]
MKKLLLFITLLFCLPTQGFSQLEIYGITVSVSQTQIAHNGSFDFGSVAVTEYRDVVFTITNVSTQTVYISGIDMFVSKTASYLIVDEPPSQIPVKSSGTFTIRFAPASEGEINTVMDIRSSSTPDPYRINLTGTGTMDDGDLLLYQNETFIAHGTGSYDFGAVSNPPVETIFTLRNTHSFSIKIAGITTSEQLGGYFEVLNVPDGLEAGGTAEFSIRFTPVRDIQYSTTVYIDHSSLSDPDPYEFTVTGTGQGLEYPDIDLRTAVEVGVPQNSLVDDGGIWDLGEIKLTQGAVIVDFNILSTGLEPLVLDPTPPVAISGTDARDFTLEPQKFPSSLDPGTFYRTRLTFEPSTLGDKTAQVSVYNNSRDHSPEYVFTYQANVVSGLLQVKQGTTPIAHAGTFNWGSVEAGTVHELSFTISNTGNAAVNITGSNISCSSGLNEFWFTQEPPASIDPGSSGSFKVTFSPLDTGVRNATVTLYNNTPTHPYTFAITGQTNSSATTTFDFSTAGWYLISLPVIPANTTVDELFADVTPYDGLAWDPAGGVNGEYVRVSTISPSLAGMGFWILVETPGSVQVSGTPVFDYQKNLVQGWHTMGSTLLECDPSAAPAIAFANDYFLAYEYNTSGIPFWDVVSFYEATKGYWTYAYDPCDLTAHARQASGAVSSKHSGEPLIASSLQLSPPPMPTLSILTSVEDKGQQLPDEFELLQNYPNPFNPTTMIRYAIPKQTDVNIKIYNIRGEWVTTLVDDVQTAGYYHVIWNATDAYYQPVSAGLYLIRFTTDDYQQSIKAIITK